MGNFLDWLLNKCGGLTFEYFYKTKETKFSKDFLFAYLQLEIPFCIFDQQQKIILSSLKLNNLLNLTDIDVLHGKKFYSYYDKNIIDQKLDEFLEKINNGEIVEEIITINNKKIHLKTTIIPFRDQETNNYSFYCFHKDVTIIENTKEHEQLYDQYRKIGENASLYFHDLNNYVTVLDGLLGIIKNKCFSENPNIKKLGESTQKAILYLDHIKKIYRGVRKILSQESIESYVPQANIQECIDEAHHLILHTLEKNNIDFINEVNEKFIANFEPIHLLQILSNLLNNSIDAISKLESKWIKITCEDKGEFLDLSIIDSGNGIHGLEEKRVFKENYTTKTDGTGFGLPLCCKIAQKNDSELILDTKSENTKFILKIKKIVVEKVQDIAIWEDRFELGISKIDDAHKDLFRIINNAHYCVINNDRKKLLKYITELETYTKKHFRDEEKFMKEINYPQFSQHRMQHEIFEMQVNELKQEVEAPDSTIRSFHNAFF